MKEISSKSKAIARAIVYAQIASDGGKFITSELTQSVDENIERCFKAGYSHKDGNILKAIKLINRQKGQHEWHYYVTRDKQGIAYYIIYFSFKMNGEVCQISFHSFNRSFENFLSPIGHTDHWDHKSSRFNALMLKERFFKV